MILLIKLTIIVARTKINTFENLFSFIFSCIYWAITSTFYSAREGSFTYFINEKLNIFDIINCAEKERERKKESDFSRDDAEIIL